MHTDWRDIDLLAISYSGTAEGVAAVEPAVRIARRLLPDAITVVLWPEALPISWLIRSTTDRQLAYGLSVRRGVDMATSVAQLSRLCEEKSSGAVIFTEPDHAPFAPAYLCYLAGIERRAGMTCEFGGGVLSQVVAPPEPPIPPEERYLYLLRELGLDWSVQPSLESTPARSDVADGACSPLPLIR